MSRRVENAVILDGPAAAMLSHAANLDELRKAVRGRDDRLYSLLTDIAITSAAWRGSVRGNQTVTSTEPDEARREPWSTPADIARQIGVHPRTIRNDIKRGILRAHLNGRIWTIEPDDATAYLESRKPA